MFRFSLTRPYRYFPVLALSGCVLFGFSFADAAAPVPADSAEAARVISSQGEAAPDGAPPVSGDAAAPSSGAPASPGEALPPVPGESSAEDVSLAAAGGPVFNRDAFPPVFFTHWEHVAIQDARDSRGMVRPPSEDELMRDLNTRDDGVRVKPPPEEREIRLGGIVYRGGKDWTIWLNGKRVTPDALPREILDLKVYKAYVEMKWFDEYTNKIFPLRIRPHQRFNIDSRIFLPG